MVSDNKDQNKKDNDEFSVELESETGGDSGTDGAADHNKDKNNELDSPGIKSESLEASEDTDDAVAIENSDVEDIDFAEDLESSDVQTVGAESMAASRPDFQKGDSEGEFADLDDDLDLDEVESFDFEESPVKKRKAANVSKLAAPAFVLLLAAGAGGYIIMNPQILSPSDVPQQGQVAEQPSPVFDMADMHDSGAIDGDGGAAGMSGQPGGIVIDEDADHYDTADIELDIPQPTATRHEEQGSDAIDFVPRAPGGTEEQVASTGNNDAANANGDDVLARVDEFVPGTGGGAEDWVSPFVDPEEEEEQGGAEENITEPYGDDFAVPSFPEDSADIEEVDTARVTMPVPDETFTPGFDGEVREDEPFDITEQVAGQVAEPSNESPEPVIVTPERQADEEQDLTVVSEAVLPPEDDLVPARSPQPDQQPDLPLQQAESSERIEEANETDVVMANASAPLAMPGHKPTIADARQSVPSPASTAQSEAQPQIVSGTGSGGFYEAAKVQVPTGPAQAVGPRSVDPKVEPGSRYIVARRTAEKEDQESLLVAASRALHLGRYDSALEMYDRLYDRNKRDVRILMGRAIAQQNLGLTESAIRSYEMALEIDPRNASAMLNMLGLIRAQYPEVALRRLLDLHRDYPQHPGVAAQIGVTEADLGNTEESLRYLGMAAGLEPANPQHFYNMAVIADRVGNIRDAIRYYERALQVDTVHTQGRALPRETIHDRLSRLRRRL